MKSRIDPNAIVSYLCWSLSDVSGSQEVFLVHHQIRVERERMVSIVCAMESYYKKGEAQMVIKFTLSSLVFLSLPLLVPEEEASRV